MNAELKVGAVTETITVTGETPVVDTQSTRRQTVIGNDLISSIPAARAYAGLMTLMPNTVVAGGAASDVQVVPGMVVFGSAGGRGNEGRLQVDGLSVGSAFNGAGVSSYIPDVGNAQEITMTTSGGLGEAEVGGPALNIVPKTGGNSIKGGFYASGVTRGMVGSNYTQDLKDRGLPDAGQPTRRSGISTSASAGRSSAIGCGSSVRCATKAVIAPCRACSRTSTPAIRPSGTTSRIRRGRLRPRSRSARFRCG